MASSCGLPKQFRDFKVVINSSKFIDLGGGSLGIKLSASGSITQVQLATLLNEQNDKTRQSGDHRRVERGLNHIRQIQQQRQRGLDRDYGSSR